MAEETIATRLARIEAHVEGCILRETSCEYWSEMHKTKLAWASNRINEATRERDELTTKVEELSDLIVELTTSLNQGENRIQSVEGVCTFRASDIRIQLQQLQETMHNHSAATSPTPSTPPHEPTGPRGPVHPSVVRREGRTYLPLLSLWEKIILKELIR